MTESKKIGAAQFSVNMASLFEELLPDVFSQYTNEIDEIMKNKLNSWINPRESMKALLENSNTKK